MLTYPSECHSLSQMGYRQLSESIHGQDKSGECGRGAVASVKYHTLTLVWCVRCHPEETFTDCDSGRRWGLRCQIMHEPRSGTPPPHRNVTGTGRFPESRHAIG